MPEHAALFLFGQIVFLDQPGVHMDRISVVSLSTKSIVVVQDECKLVQASGVILVAAAPPYPATLGTVVHLRCTALHTAAPYRTAWPPGLDWLTYSLTHLHSPTARPPIIISITITTTTTTTTTTRTRPDTKKSYNHHPSPIVGGSWTHNSSRQQQRRR